MVEKINSKQILDRWATCVIPKEAIFIKDGQPQVNQGKAAHYEERGYQGDEVLWIAPKDCLRIEFEDTPDHNHRYILEIESVAKSLGFDYCVTGHNGKSDYFNVFNIVGMPLGEDNNMAKLLLVDLLMPAVAKDQLDRTNLGWTLSPIIGHRHWKPKYNGEIHKILRGKNPLKHENKYPAELVKQIKKAKTKLKKAAIKTKQNDSWVEDFLLNYCCSNILPAGSRHYIIEKNLAAFIMLRKDKEEIKERYYKSQGRTSDTLRTWEAAILRGSYGEVSAGELYNFIKEHSIPYNVPFKEEGFASVLKIDNYIENVQKFYGVRPFFYDDTGDIFWFWKDNRYKRISDVRLMDMLDETLGFMGQTVSSSIKNQYLEAFKRVGLGKKPENAPIKWIQFKDKAISLTSAKIHNVTPDYFFTNPIPWDIGKNDDVPVIDKLIEEWVGKEYKQTAYEIIAYCCYSDYPIHIIVCLVGCGRNGKSKFIGLINKFIGQENVCSTELDNLLNSRFESSKLYKKLVCTMGETNFGVISKTSLLKKLTGQDLIGFEFKNRGLFDDYSYAKVIIGSNSLPTTTDTSEGYYRRWMILDFPNTFPEGHDILKDIPDNEFNNLAFKVSKILPTLIERGMFDKQGTIEERKEKYIMSSNPLSNFIKIKCMRGHNKFMRYSELYTHYIQFLDKNKKRKISYKEFNDVLAIEGLEVTKTSKKVGEEWLNGRFIEGLELVTPVTLMTPFQSALYENQLSENISTGVTSGTIQEELLQKTDLNQKIMVIIEHLANKNGPTVLIEDVIKTANKAKIPAEKAEEVIEHLKKTGMLFEPRYGYLSIL